MTVYVHILAVCSMVQSINLVGRTIICPTAKSYLHNLQCNFVGFAQFSIIAECLSVRHIIVRVRQALMGRSLRLLPSVTGLRLKYTTLRTVYVPSSTCA